MLRRDFQAAAADRIARIVELEEPDAADRFGALRRKQDEYYVEGRDKGINGLLEVSIELARLALKAAPDADERGAAENDLGNALGELGERERGTVRLEEAVVACRAALEEWTRERGPLKWAMAQMNLGTALTALGARARYGDRGGGGGLSRRAGREDAGACSTRLGDDAEQSRQCAPKARRAGERDGAARGSGGSLSRGAVGKDARARSTRRGNDAGRICEHAFLSARWTLKDDNSMRRLKAIRAALEEKPRERVSLRWAMIQHNLGNALRTFGERESGTTRLEEAVMAYRAALEEKPRERVPLSWAASFGSQGVAMMMIADRTNDGALAEAAMTQIATAYEALRDGGHAQWAIYYEEQLPKAQAIRNRLKRK